MRKKKDASEKHIALAAWAAAANGINPIPGVDVAIDVSIILKLFSDIRSDFGLTEDVIDTQKESQVENVAFLANTIAQLASKDAVLKLLSKYAGKMVAKRFAKYIPIVGQAIAAGIGYAITTNAGWAYLNDCYDLAKQVLENELQIQ